MRPEPVVTFSTLAQLLGPLSQPHLHTLLRGHKYPTPGPKRSYQNAVRQTVEHLVAGAPFSPHAGNLRPHEREVVGALARQGVPIPRDLVSRRPDPRQPTWRFSGVTISMYPDVLVASNGHTGVFKLYAGKRALAPGVGTAMAGLLHHHRREIVGDPSADPACCLVYEARTGKLFTPGRSPSRLLNGVMAACQTVAALWPVL